MDSILKNKRGAAMATNTIILVVLGLIVLVILVIGFNQGWSNIAPWIQADGPGDLTEECNRVCQMKDVKGKYKYCSEPRSMKVEGTTYTNVTCNYLTENMDEYVQADCDISCDVQYVDVSSKEALEEKCDEQEYKGNTVQALIDDSLKTVQC